MYFGAVTAYFFAVSMFVLSYFLVFQRFRKDSDCTEKVIGEVVDFSFVQYYPLLSILLMVRFIEWWDRNFKGVYKPRLGHPFLIRILKWMHMG